MALVNVSLVTQALVRLLKEGFAVSPGWTPLPVPNVSPAPPDKLPANSLGFYLYHVAENGHLKNLPAPGNDTPPVRYAPMALDLFYVLSTNSADASDPGVYRTQRMMGCAVKILHDFPVVDDRTDVNGVKILASANLDGADNAFRVVLQPVPHREAVSYWTAGSTPLRLAAYYQVSVVMLEPEPTRARSGRVLAWGIQTFTSGPPRLETSRNSLTIALPGEADPRTVELSPAQVPVGGPVAFLGSGLSGDRVALRLRTELWSQPVEVDSAWGVAAAGDRLLAVVQSTAAGEDVLPGTYSAAAKVVVRRPLPDGRVREFAHVSNDTPFAITPRIDAVSVPAADGSVTVTGYIFKHVGLRPEAVEVYVADSRLEQKPAAPLTPGQFAVVSAATLQLRLPAGLTPRVTVPLRVLVNGAESPPGWVQVP